MRGQCISFFVMMGTSKEGRKRNGDFRGQSCEKGL